MSFFILPIYGLRKAITKLFTEVFEMNKRIKDKTGSNMFLRKIPTSRKNGFTLIELLVVISIIALLMAIIMPALGKARCMSKRIRCAAGMKQISIAFMNYGIDNKDRIIKASKVMGSSNPWIWALLPYIDGNSQKSGTWESPAELWFCPADKDPYPLGYSPHGQKYTSYALNGCYQKATAGGGWTSSSPEVRLGPAGGYRYSRIESPSECMLMVETSYYGQIYDCDNSKVSSLRLEQEGHHRNTSGFYHSEKMNLLFVDGRVAPIKGRRAERVEAPFGISDKGYMFWPDLSLPDSTEKSALWGPGY
jgi:prepilin-type N-terminal cleavage/methylation domain-containing protein/prepilin-type processing-associated H-X9-DG protein